MTNDDDSNILRFPVRNYVRFWPDFIECDWCGQLTRGRVYEDSGEVCCGSCKTVLYEFPLTDSYIEFTPGDDEDAEE